jgi:uncharacterized protein (TIGR02996 family)
MRLVRTDGREKRETWEILLAGKTVTSIANPHAATRRPRKQRFASVDKAQRAYDALIAQQRAAGFREVGEIDAPAVPIVRDEELEAALREDRDDPAPYLVYADWLLGRGSPLGEMIVLAHRKQARRAQAIARRIGLPSPDIATFGWRHGLWQWLRIENEDDWMDAGFDVRPFARALFASPLCAALEELRVGIIRWDHNHEDVPALLAEAGRHAWAHDLPRLHLGDVPHNVDMAHHVVGDIGALITRGFPGLVRLKLHSGEQRWRTKKETFGVAGLALPRLEELVVETCALTRKRVRALAAAELPALARLELWFGARDHDADATAADVAPLVDGRFPALRHLALRNSELAGELVPVLAGSRAARRLETLDLSMGTLDDAEARELAAQARRFPQLARLVVDDTYVTTAGARALRAGFGRGVAVSAADRKEPYDWDPAARFVSVAE